MQGTGRREWHEILDKGKSKRKQSAWKSGEKAGIVRILAENYCISRGNFQQTEKERNTVAVGPGE